MAKQRKVKRRQWQGSERANKSSGSKRARKGSAAHHGPDQQGWLALEQLAHRHLWLCMGSSNLAALLWDPSLAH